MKYKNTLEQYGLVATSFHWVIAVLIIAQLAVGLYMVDLPLEPSKFELYGLHKEFGTVVLILASLRVLWRWSNIVPPQLNYIPKWQAQAARLSHFLLYVSMFAMPLTGWIMSSAGGFPVSFFGLFVLPDLVSPNKELSSFFQETHAWIGYALIALITLHIAATVQHYVVYKENILKKMWPLGK